MDEMLTGIFIGLVLALLFWVVFHEETIVKSGMQYGKFSIKKIDSRWLVTVGNREPFFVYESSNSTFWAKLIAQDGKELIINWVNVNGDVTIWSWEYMSEVAKVTTTTPATEVPS